MKKLEALLGVHEKNPAQLLQSKAGRSQSTHDLHHAMSSLIHRDKGLDVTNDHQQQLNVQVTSFFSDTPSGDLRQLIQNSKCSYFDLILRACSRHTRYQLAIAHSLHPILIYLPIDELELMVMSFVGLELYRDHKCLLNLVEALTIRRTSVPEDMKNKAIIVSLQERILKRCIDFHESLLHHHVVPIIQKAQEQLSGENPILLDHEDQLCLSIIPPLVRTVDQASARSVVPTLSTSRGSAPAPHFFARVEPSKTSEHGVNTVYQYTSEDIQAILVARVASMDGVEVLAGAKMTGTANYQANTAADVLQGYLEGVVNIPNQKKHILIPIEVNNNHWVGIRLRVDEGVIQPGVSYFNSMHQEAQDARIMQEIQTNLARILPGPIVVDYVPRCFQQSDSTSCGAYLIENMYCEIKQKYWSIKPDERTRAFRGRHLELLKASVPAYYPTFNQRQLNNEGLSHRLDWHG